MPRLEDGRLDLTAFRAIDRFASDAWPVLERWMVLLDRLGGGNSAGMVGAAAARTC